MISNHDRAEEIARMLNLDPKAPRVSKYLICVEHELTQAEARGIRKAADIAAKAFPKGSGIEIDITVWDIGNIIDGLQKYLVKLIYASAEELEKK